ncbi:MAG: alpha/beta hydrolase-fold protein [Polyangiaceae bacterium]
MARAVHLPIRRRDAIVALGVAAAHALPIHADPVERIDTVDVTSDFFDVKDLFVEGDPKLATRFSLIMPKALPKDVKVPLVVALHGLGESGDESLGVRAWPELYGLKTSYERLKKPPVVRESKRKDFTDERLEEVNQLLSTRGFRGVAIACPWTRHIADFPDPKAAYDAYTAWLMDVVIPRARIEGPVSADPLATSIVGCSMGGPVALEVFQRHPEAFGSVGLVQGAVSAFYADKNAQMIADAAASYGRRDVLLLSSQGDPFRDGHEAFAKALDKRGVPNSLRVPPGPHDQPFLRETGSIELLLYQDGRWP